MNKTLFVFLLFIATAFSLSAKHHKGHGDRKGMKGPMHAKMLEKMDADKDGKISKQEWQTYHDQKFTELDADKDGAISHDEFKAHHQKMMKEHQSKMGMKGERPGADEKNEKRPPRRKKKNKSGSEPTDGSPAEESE
jgi:hypothetical protein